MLCIVGDVLVAQQQVSVVSSDYARSGEASACAWDAESENLHLERVIEVYPNM